MGLNVGKADVKKVLNGFTDDAGNLKINQKRSSSEITMELILDELMVMNKYNELLHGIKITNDNL